MHAGVQAHSLHDFPSPQEVPKIPRPSPTICTFTWWPDHWLFLIDEGASRQNTTCVMVWLNTYQHKCFYLVQRMLNYLQPPRDCPLLCVASTTKSYRTTHRTLWQGGLRLQCSDKEQTQLFRFQLTGERISQLSVLLNSLNLPSWLLTLLLRLRYIYAYRRHLWVHSFLQGDAVLSIEYHCMCAVCKMDTQDGSQAVKYVRERSNLVHFSCVAALWRCLATYTGIYHPLATGSTVQLRACTVSSACFSLLQELQYHVTTISCTP